MKDELLKIGERLHTQNNRITDNPMFIVQQRRSFSCEAGEGEEDVWYDEDWGEVDEETSEKLDEIESLCIFDFNQQRFLDRHTKRGLKHFWEFCMAAFTEEGCKEYLRLNGHNLKEPRIYVMSFNRCPEMLAIRQFLMEQVESE